MFKKLYIFVFTVLFIGNVFVSNVYAETGNLNQEAILFFASNITVNVDNSIDVIETVTYNTGPSEHHGIYRDIYPYSSQEGKMEIGGVSVMDPSGNPYTFELTNSGDYFRIKIGDTGVTFLGQKTYVIHYHVTRAVAQLKDGDEIYWNVTGNNWTMPIYGAIASVALPYGTKVSQSACYMGVKGSTERCQQTSDTMFSASSVLNSGEGLTVAVGFPKGVVTPYSAFDNAESFFEKYKSWILIILLPIVTFIFSFIYWRRKGRDPKGRGVIVPQYDVLDNLTPMEVAFIVNEKNSSDNISAEIIYLATKGYIKIRQISEKKFFNLFDSSDYELTKLKDFSDIPNGFDSILLKGFFSDKLSYAGTVIRFSDLKEMFKGKISLEKTKVSREQTGVIRMSELENLFYPTVIKVIKSVGDSVLSKKYYKSLGRLKSPTKEIPFILFVCLYLPIILGLVIGQSLFPHDSGVFVLGVALSGIIFSVFYHLSPSKTDKGVEAKEYLLGLKEYLQIAEKNRLEFHNAPAKTPEIFEKLLPYAMVLGVTDIWTKEFEGIYTTPPSWYSGYSGSNFSAVAFGNSLSNFSNFTLNSLTSTPGGSGGSGGGGFSGGGGGGGGGGSW